MTRLMEPWISPWRAGPAVVQ